MAEPPRRPILLDEKEIDMVTTALSMLINPATFDWEDGSHEPGEQEEYRQLAIRIAYNGATLDAPDSKWTQSWNIVSALEMLIHVRKHDQDGRRAAAALANEIYALTMGHVTEEEALTDSDVE